VAFATPALPEASPRHSDAGTTPTAATGQRAEQQPVAQLQLLASLQLPRERVIGRRMELAHCGLVAFAMQHPEITPVGDSAA
jgi:hypothetical protein